MRRAFRRPLASPLILLLCSSLVLTPGMVSLAFAADPPTPSASPAPPAPAADKDQAAPAAQTALLKKLAKAGYLEGQRDPVLSAKTLTRDQATDAVMEADQALAELDLKSLKPGDYDPADLADLLQLTRDKAADLRARKASAWGYENRIQKMIAALGPAPDGGKPEAAPPKALPPAATQADLASLRADLADLSKKASDLQAQLDKKTDALSKSNDDLKSSQEALKASNDLLRASNDEVKASNVQVKAAQADAQEQLRLVKRLMDRVQDDLKKTDDRLDQVDKKAAEKTMTDAELQQELTVMHKDLRDNTQDLSILRQQVAKLDKSGEKADEGPLDAALGSKWLAGGALVVGLAALVLTLTKK